MERDENIMKTDIFEDMRIELNCKCISDLPFHKREILELIKQHVLLNYPKEQVEKLSHYVFGVDYAVIVATLETSCKYPSGGGDKI